MDPLRQRRSVWLTPWWLGSGLVAAVMLVGLVTLAPSPAGADEFRVQLLIQSAQVDADAYRDGFQLAVDQSPDVSHPAGVEGGDHLGAMDVVILVATDSGTGAFPDVGSSFPPIVVVEGESDFVLEMVQTVSTTGSFLIGVSDSDDLVNIVTPDSFVVGSSDIDELLDERNFTATFETVYGRTPSAAATRGYLAGRLVDLAIEATERDPSDRDTMAQALGDLLNPSPGSGVAQPEPEGVSDVRPEQSDVGPGEADSSSEPLSVPMLILTGATIVVVLLGGLILRRFTG